MKTKNPTIIFGDTHDDSVNMRLIIKLLPQLKEMGYHRFFDEMPPGYVVGEKGTLDEVIEKHKQSTQAIIQYYIQPWIDWRHAFEAQIKHLRGQESATSDISKLTIIRNSMAWLETQIAKITRLENLANNCRADNLDQIKELQSELEYYVNNLPDVDSVYVIKDSLRDVLQYRYPSLDLFRHIILFLESIKQNAFSIEGIDDVCTIELQESQTYVDYFDASKKEKLLVDSPARNITMATNFVATEQGVIGRTGLMHVDKIQKHIVENMSLTEAKAKFIFIHVSNDKDENMFVDEIDNPLGYVWIDGRTKSDDEIVEIILQKIREHQKILNHTQATSYKLPGQRLFIDKMDVENPMIHDLSPQRRPS